MDKAPRLLFVDDEPNIRILVAAILGQKGFTVTVAAAVSEALNLIATQKFDVLISDLNIGDAGDGFTVVSAMRRTQPDAVTFILTGYPAFETALEAIRQQVDDYFVKPADLASLVDKIHASLDGPRREMRRVKPRRAIEIVNERKDEIVARWLAMARSDEEIQLAHLTDDQLTDQLPDIINEIISRTRREQLSPDAMNAAQGHGKARLQQGCGITAMIRETRILHEVVCQIINENLLAVDVSTVIADVMTIGETVQAFLEVSIRSFVQGDDN